MSGAPLISIISGLIQLLQGLIVIWCLLSWFPNIRWQDQPFRALDMMVSPIIAPFRKIIPPGLLGNIDISPMIALIVIQMAGSLIMSMLPY